MEFLITSAKLAGGLRPPDVADILAAHAFSTLPVASHVTGRFAVHATGARADDPLFDGYGFGRTELHHPRYSPPSPADARGLLATLPERGGGFVVGLVDQRQSTFIVAT